MSDDSKRSLQLGDIGSTPSLTPPAQLVANRYEVLGLLGVGGMGAVYKVRDRELDEMVALKMLKREIADSPGIVDRFRREVKLARRVTHPNVARTYDLGEHEGERFLTMEYIEGESLAAIAAREGQLPLAQIVDLVSAICAGLEAAHGAGVVHRDLKPDNVLVSHGRVVITDFGIARAQEAGAASRTAVPVGTPAYMSPEQVEARADIDGRADIYALGVMIYELLTGHLPFEADSIFAVAAMRLTQPPPDPRIHRADLPESVALLVQRCMARRPEDRPASAKEIATRLSSLTLPASEALMRTGENRAMIETNDGAHKTVAVLPFRNAGPPEDEYLVDGLTDDLIDTLSMTPGLRVRPRGVVMQHRNAGDPRQLGRDLNVQVVIDGTMRSTADAIRVSARVLSVEDGFQIWAKRFDGTRADVLRIGDDASRAIAGALAVRKPTRAALITDPLAVDLYLRGRHEYMKFWSSANERAIELLSQAHERAPDDPLIMAGYAAALSRQSGISFGADLRHATARDVAERATRLAPRLAEGHVALGNVRLHDIDAVGCAACIVRALALSPLLPDAHELRARLLAEVGDPYEAIECARRTMQLEPRLSHLTYTVIARTFAALHDWDEVAQYFRVVPEDPDVASLYWIATARMVMWKRSPEEARVLQQRISKLPPFDSLPIVAMACQVLITKTVPEQQREFATARARDAPTMRMRTYWHQLSAEIDAYVEDLELAMANVRASVELGLIDIVWMNGCPLLDPLRDRPDFEALRSEVATRASRVVIELRGGEATLAT